MSSRRARTAEWHLVLKATNQNNQPAKQPNNQQPNNTKQWWEDFVLVFSLFLRWFLFVCMCAPVWMNATCLDGSRKSPRSPRARATGVTVWSMWVLGPELSPLGEHHSFNCWLIHLPKDFAIRRPHSGASYLEWWPILSTTRENKVTSSTGKWIQPERDWWIRQDEYSILSFVVPRFHKQKPA